MGVDARSETLAPVGDGKTPCTRTCEVYGKQADDPDLCTRGYRPRFVLVDTPALPLEITSTLDIYWLMELLNEM